MKDAIINLKAALKRARTINDYDFIVDDWFATNCEIVGQTYTITAEARKHMGDKYKEIGKHCVTKSFAHEIANRLPVVENNIPIHGSRQPWRQDGEIEFPNVIYNSEFRIEIVVLK